MTLDISISLRAGKLTEDRSLRMAGTVDQVQQGQGDSQGNAMQDTQYQLACDDDQSNAK